MPNESLEHLKEDFDHQDRDSLIAALRAFFQIYANRDNWRKSAGAPPHHLRDGMALDFHPSNVVDGYRFADEAIAKIERFYSQQEQQEQQEQPKLSCEWSDDDGVCGEPAQWRTPWYTFLCAGHAAMRLANGGGITAVEPEVTTGLQHAYAKATSIICDIEQIRTTEGNSVTINCDNPEADTLDQQAAVDVCGDFTEWKEVRYWGVTWTEALRKAADASRSFEVPTTKSERRMNMDEAQLLKEAANEIRSLRRQNELLNAKLEGAEMMAMAVASERHRGPGLPMGECVASKIEAYLRDTLDDPRQEDSR